MLDADWDVSPVTKQNKDRAWSQLGTSGSGNHFVEFGLFTAHGQIHGLEPGTYLALLSHSGSRGTGAAVCDHYSKLAFSQFPDLPSELKRLAWLSLDSQEGQEYWAAMELMGRYAAANHALIHKHVAANLGAEVLLDLENHHNFAWKERHVINGVEKEVIVHRKGATPAGQGVLGIIPGSMASPGFVVSGKGNAGVPELGFAWRGSGDEPHAGEQDLRVEEGECLPAREGRDPDLGRLGRGADGLQEHPRGHGGPEGPRDHPGPV